MLTGCPSRVSLSGTMSVFARVRINKKGKTTVRPVCPTPKEFVHFQHCQPPPFLLILTALSMKVGVIR